MARNKMILSLAACALLAALASPVLVQSDDDGVNSDARAELKQMEDDVARLKAAMKRIEELVARERARLRQSVDESDKTKENNDTDEKQTATDDADKPNDAEKLAGGEEDTPEKTDGPTSTRSATLEADPTATHPHVKRI